MFNNGIALMSLNIFFLIVSFGYFLWIRRKFKDFVEEATKTQKLILGLHNIVAYLTFSKLTFYAML